ncbi:MAG: hypothetical protein E6682_15325 [Clostridium perfringens]|uniref:Uncharacterized protein n=1 Tax=Clostridium perfringens TaxID=1502 RepID=A0AAW9K341_CLOPF|nr:hypothetical protein [Clostridium perfringens]UVX36146.1 MAG: hypothetical protein [Bacteriophage sp.]EGT3604717.1 hypothetical protein [Clostridium perfringens]EHR1329652.1 hypothetical protein [Clostridium perfringens]EHR1332778.1 hypothetical protein [Clostridium perfringens]EHR1426328.1 hypothetical protein [Clostridium perfringens]
MAGYVKIVEIDKEHNRSSEDIQRLNDLIIVNQLKLNAKKNSLEEIEIRYYTESHIEKLET